MKNPLPRYEIALAVGLAFCGLALAQDALSGPSTSGPTAAPPPADTAAPIPTASNAARRLTAAFTGFAGSQANAAALVDGLRSGSAIMLTGNSTDAGGGRLSAVTFMPPTQAMGYGNIRIALSLAQASLASQGITQPTPQQLQSALTGSGATGSTASPGVLQLRAQGMGWGEIAGSMGVKLGTVMNNHQPNVPATAAQTTTGNTDAAPAKVTTAAGPAGSYGAPGRSSGIVTASGGAAGVLLTGSHGHGIAVGGGGMVNAQGIVHGNSGGGNPGRGGKT